MISIDFFNNISKQFIICIIIYFISIKIINYENNSKLKKIIVVVSSFILALIYSFLKPIITSIPTFIIIYSIYTIIFSALTKNKISYSVIGMLISVAINYVSFGLSVIVTIITKHLLFSNIPNNSPVLLFPIFSLHIFILFHFLKIKRFKNGIYFLYDKRFISNIGIMGIVLCSILTTIYSIFTYTTDDISSIYLLISFGMLSLIAIIWLFDRITVYYKQTVRDQIIEDLDKELENQKEVNAKLSKQNSELSKILHEYNHRMSAMETAILNTEFAMEHGDIVNLVKDFSKEYTNTTNKITSKKRKLVPTNVLNIDKILEYMQLKAIENNVDFIFKLSGNINYMVENIIDKNKLETLIADMINNSIIAINHTYNTNRRIMVFIEIINNCYEFKILDTGIPFEIDTLVKLGLERSTTHSETGGTGIGFETTFETLRECKASLIIEENEQINTGYTKTIIIRFDEKNEYIVKTYRDKKLKLKDKNNRIIIQSL